MNASGMLGFALGTAAVGSFFLGRFDGSIVDGVLRARGETVSVERSGRTGARARTGGGDGDRGDPASVRGPAHVGRTAAAPGGLRGRDGRRQQATLLLLALFVVLTLAASTLLPKGESEPTEPSPDRASAPDRRHETRSLTDE